MASEVSFLHKFVNLILYSNIFIAACAIAMTWQTELLLFGKFEWSNVSGLIFFATFLIYALHRIVGLFKVEHFIHEGRFRVINQYKSHIWIYATLSFVAFTYFFFQVNLRIQLALVIPGIISFGYVLPIIGGKKQLRLRDLDGIKIFLIALVWAFVTVLLPVLAHRSLVWSDGLIFLERAIFIFTITLPFDIRDERLDRFNEVKTIPTVIGIPKTQTLIQIGLATFTLLAFLNYYVLSDIPKIYATLALIASALVTQAFIKLSNGKTNDYYFTGLIDGTMLLQFILVWTFSLIISG